MGQTPVQIAGNVPHPKTYAHVQWRRAVWTAIVAYCAVTRATTYYFDSSKADDSGDGLSPATAKKTVTAAQTIVTASSGNIALKFIRDGVFRGVNLLVNKANVTVSAYGTGAKPPVITGMNNVQVGTTGWTNTSGNVYQRTVTGTIRWAQEDDDYSRPWSQQDSIAHVQANPGSWYFTGTTLYVQLRSGAAPGAQTSVEWTNLADASGIEVSGDGCLVENITATWWGMNSGGNQAYNCKVTTASTDVALVRNCTLIGSNAHPGGGFHGTGGASYWQNCTLGGTMGTTGTCLNFYCNTGTSVVGWDDGCVFTMGSLPQYSVTAANDGTFALYAHTSTSDGVNYFASRVSSNATILGTATNPPRTPFGIDVGCAAPVTGFGTAAARWACTVFGLSQERASNVIMKPSNNTAFILCHFRVQPVDVGTRTMYSGLPVNVGYFGNIIEFDGTNLVTADRFGFISVAYPTQPLMHFENNRISTTNLNRGLTMLESNYFNNGVWSSSYFYSNVVEQRDGTGNFSWHAASLVSTGNAWNTTEGSSGDSAPILLQSPAPLVPGPGSQLYGTASLPADGIRPWWNWRDLGAVSMLPTGAGNALNLRLSLQL